MQTAIMHQSSGPREATSGRKNTIMSCSNDEKLSREAVQQFQELVQANIDSVNVLTEICDRMKDPTTSDILRGIANRRTRQCR